jgi:hypothetical protein
VGTRHYCGCRGTWAHITIAVVVGRGHASLLRLSWDVGTCHY